MADERGDQRDAKIYRSHNVPERAQDCLLVLQMIAIKFTHQQVGVEEKNDEGNFNHSAPEALERTHWVA